MQDQAAFNLSSKSILALTGGVGGAKLALGLSKILSPDQLTIVANTADDFKHLGLSISPDLDTVMYTLAQISNTELGWGLHDESWNAMEALARLGGDTWFRLGDRDLATHIVRSQQLAKGHTLTQVTDQLCERLSVAHRLLPMTDDPVHTRVSTSQGDLAFQEYFVREQCKPAISEVHFDGIKSAVPQQQFLQLLQSDQLAAIIICPSNPFVSVEPILQLPGVREAMRNSAAPVIAVSPIVGGVAIKGPAAKMMSELDMPITAAAVADYYGDLLDGFVIDSTDSQFQSQLQSQLQIQHQSSIASKAQKVPVQKVLCTQTVMKTLHDRIELAKQIVQFVNNINGDLTDG
jgi:LPPG:FO 2-phospho-L-lactate transferase